MIQDKILKILIFARRSNISVISSELLLFLINTLATPRKHFEYCKYLNIPLHVTLRIHFKEYDLTIS
jgi:hypothetical protein